MSTEALRELLDALTTPFPPETAGHEAQLAWGDRNTAAVAQARAALAAAPAGGAEPACPNCGGTGVDGDVGDRGEIVETPCACRSTAPTAQLQPAGLSPLQESKYTVNGHAIVNRASGEEIPADEPVFIFRARDKWAAGVLGDYATFVEDPAHKAAVEERFIQFGEWAEAHPERMKEPDTQPSQPTLLNGLTEQETAASASVAGLSGAQPEAPAEPSGLVIPEECAHLIMFDDQDKKPAVFAGAGARTAALAAYERMSVSWNAHLFVCIDHNSRDQGYPVAKVATPAPVAQQQQAELSLTEIGNVWDSLKAIHGGEPCRHAHVEFARAVIKAQGGSQ